MRIGVVGINHKLADLQLRELLAKACLRRFGIGQSIHGEHTFIVLLTCNRTEVYFTSEDLAATHTYLLTILRSEVDCEFDQKLYSYFGYECFLHLARVTAGLDSAIIAETEIQGQVKAAYEKVIEFIHLPEEMHYLFQKSLKIAKNIRAHLPIQKGLPDLEHAILSAGHHFFPNPQQTKILFVGASEINQKVLSFFRSKQIPNITLCNRSYDHAREMAFPYGLDILEWNQISHWHLFDWVIFGTKAPNHLVTTEGIPGSCLGRKLVMDLSVPRNVDPGLGRDSRITLLNIDQLNRSLAFRRKKIQRFLSKSNEIAKISVKQHLEIFDQKQKQKERWLVLCKRKFCA
jgi:glutamyl-tRNA reductase